MEISMLHASNLYSAGVFDECARVRSAPCSYQAHARSRYVLAVSLLSLLAARTVPVTFGTEATDPRGLCFTGVTGKGSARRRTLSVCVFPVVSE
eukprot:1153173-Pelagomonas_calceolata.AAC.5